MGNRTIEINEKLLADVQREFVISQYAVHGRFNRPPTHCLRISIQEKEIAENLIVSAGAARENAELAHCHLKGFLQPDLFNFVVDLALQILPIHCHLSFLPSGENNGCQFVIEIGVVPTVHAAAMECIQIFRVDFCHDGTHIRQRL